ncbi:expressed unknown protein [Seminavis robusta]|uniref:Uncharacterized protein n=1 Tax=Seminavis robusta TaxID=568900 RepID=A0A9N8EW59_9STRA|nr:expressed unknown protein [Seminavis robusta]|eukprot:Sro1941_g306680.1 n/a (367) ;mRNA; r:15381-16578
MTDPLPSAGAAASAATRTSNPSSATTMSTVASNTGSHGASALLSSGLSKEVVSENIFPFLDYKSIIRCMTVKPIADAFCLEQYYCIEHGRKLVPQDGLWKEFKEAHSGGDDDEEVGVSQEELWKQIEIENNNNSTQEEETSNSPPTSNSHDKEKQSGKMDQHTCNSFQQPECPDCLEGTLFNRERCPNCSQEGGDDVWIRQCSKCPARSCNECDESIFNCEGCDEEFCHPRARVRWDMTYSASSELISFTVTAANTPFAKNAAVIAWDHDTNPPARRVARGFVASAKTISTVKTVDTGIAMIARRRSFVRLVERKFVVAAVPSLHVRHVSGSFVGVVVKEASLVAFVKSPSAGVHAAPHWNVNSAE